MTHESYADIEMKLGIVFYTCVQK